jgi:hypothetical protein
MKPGTREQDRETEDDIAREKLGPRGVPVLQIRQR